MSQCLRAGIVGFGYMGEIRFRNVNAHPDLVLEGICDPHRSDEIEMLGVPVFDRWQDLVAAGLDTVFVCTPNYLIPEIAVAVLNAGQHVFCEKPPGRNLGDIERVRAAEAANQGGKLVFGFNHRHHPGITDAKAIIDSGSLGAILTLRGVYGKDGGYEYHTSWRNDPELAGGGILLDQGLHMLDLFRFFVGDFEEVMGIRSTTIFEGPVEDNAMVILRTARGQLAQLHSSATSWKHTFRIEIGCEKGYVTINGLLSKSGSYGRETLLVGRRSAPDERVAIGNPREETTYYDLDPSWDLEVGYFVECIREEKPVVHGSSLDALRAMEIVHRVYQSFPIMRCSAARPA